MGAFLPVALTVASGALKVFGSIFGGASQRAAANQRAKLLEDAAGQDLNESGIAAQLAIDQGNRVDAHLATEAGASGGGTGGNVLEVLGDLQRQSLYNAKAAIYAGRTSARAKRLQAVAERKAGKDAFISGLVGGASSLLSTFGSLASQGQQNQLYTQLAGDGGGGGGLGGAGD